MPGDLLVVRPGEIVPVDGRIERDVAVLDESASPVNPPVRASGGRGRPQRLSERRRCIHPAGDHLRRREHVRRDRTAGGRSGGGFSSAPFVRLADRYAAAALAVSLAAAVLAWAVSGDPVRGRGARGGDAVPAHPRRSGRHHRRHLPAASRGVVIKGGLALERLAEGRVLLLDKTGTLTAGHPEVTEIIPIGARSADEVLGAAVARPGLLHVVAAAVVRAARDRGLAIALPHDVEEVPGSGVRGTVAGRSVSVGKSSWVAPMPIPVGEADPSPRRSSTERSRCSSPSTASQRERSARRSGSARCRAHDP